MALFEATIEPKGDKMLGFPLSLRSLLPVRPAVAFLVCFQYFLIGNVLSIILPTVATAQSINFYQSGGLVSFRSITQSNSVSHKIIGLGAGGVASDSQAAVFTGNFNSIVIDQTGTASQTLAARIAVSNSASVGFHMRNSVASSMTVNVNAGNYISDVTTSGAGKKLVYLVVDAPGKTVVQNIDVSGGPVTLRVNQTNSANYS